MSGVPYPPVANTPLIDRRFERILGELESLRREAAEDRSTETIRNATLRADIERIRQSLLLTCDRIESLRLELQEYAQAQAVQFDRVAEQIRDARSATLNAIQEARVSLWSDFWAGARAWFNVSVWNPLTRRR